MGQLTFAINADSTKMCWARVLIRIFNGFDCSVTWNDTFIPTTGF